MLRPRSLSLVAMVVVFVQPAVVDTAQAPQAMFRSNGLPLQCSKS